MGTFPTAFAGSFECSRWDESGKGRGPTTDNYVFDLVGAPLSPWNRAFVGVGVKAFIDAGKGDASNEPAVTAIFFEHFKRLREACKAEIRKLETEAPAIINAKRLVAAQQKSRKKNKQAVRTFPSLSSRDSRTVLQY